MADNSQNTEETVKHVVEQLQTFGRELDPIAQGQKDLHDKAKTRYAELQKDFKSLGGAAFNAAKAMNQVSDGASKYGDAVAQGASAVKGLASNFGIIGKAIGFVVDAFGKLASGALKQNENLVKTYRSLSEAGDLSNSSFEQLGKDVRAAGFSMDQNAEKFADAVKKAAPELASFGGTVAEGKKRLLSTFGDTLKTTEKQLERYGITSEEAFSRTASYMGQLTNSNTARKLSDKELNANSIKYMETLVGLAAITGATRDEAEKARQEQMNDLRWQMKLSEMKTEDADRLRDSMTAIQLKYGKEVAEGAKSMLVNNGRLVDEQGQKFYQMFGNKGYQSLKKAIDSGEEVPVAMARMFRENAPAVAAKFKQFSGTIALNNESMKDMGASIELYTGNQSSFASDEEKIRKELGKVREDGKNDDIDANTERKKAERKVRNAFEELEYNISKIIIPTLNSFTNAMVDVGAKFADILYDLGGPDIRDAFVTFNSMTEVTQQLIKQQKKQAELTKDLNEAQKELADTNKEIQEAEESIKKGGFGSFRAHVREPLLQAGKKELEEKIAKMQGELARSKSVTQRATGMGGEMAREEAASTPTATASAGSLAGLTIKKGDVHQEGAHVDPKLIEIAKQVQGMPGFKYFSSFNDKYHQDKNSQHNKGKAFDFVLDHWPSEEEGKGIAEKLKGMGISRVIDEYNHPSSGATGGHIHAQLQGKTQGLFKGPESGYWLKAHGEEALVNKNGLANLVSKTQWPGGSGINGGTEMMSNLQSVMSEMVDKLDTLIELQRTANGTREEILTHTKA